MARKWGRGSVVRRGDRFRASIQIDSRRFTKSFEREVDAWSWLTTIKADAVRGVLKVEGEVKKILFIDLARMYKVHKLRRWKEGTIRFFDGHIKSTLLPAFGKRIVSEITTVEIQRFLDGRLDHVSPGTVAKYQQLLGQLFNYATRMGYIDRSPMSGVERAMVVNSPKRVLKPHELRAFLESCEGEAAAFFTVMALTGLRRAEMFRLSWDWCDFEEEWLYIKEAKRGSNDMPMSPRVKTALLSLGPKRSGRVFPGHRRGESPSTTANPFKELTDKRRAMRTALKRSGVDPQGVTFHTFRRTFATLLDLTPGISYGVVRALTRHGASKNDITARYLHPSRDDLRRALLLLEEKVFARSNVVLFPCQVAG